MKVHRDKIKLFSKMSHDSLTHLQKLLLGNTKGLNVFSQFLCIILQYEYNYTADEVKEYIDALESYGEKHVEGFQRTHGAFDYLDKHGEPISNDSEYIKRKMNHIRSFLRHLERNEHDIARIKYF